MARRYERMSEAEAREELSHGHDPRDRGRPYADRAALHAPWYDPASMLAPYPDVGYGPPRPGWHRDRRRLYEDGRWRDDARERDFLDRAGDEIASWFGDGDAEARREADHRGRGPKGYVRSDIRIEEDVHDRLRDDPYLDASDIEVTVKDREVTLDGHVESRSAKRLAEDCVDSVAGVAHVQNNLRVRPGAG